MRSHLEAGPPLDAPQRLLEAVVLERIDLAAVVAHDVVVMVTTDLRGLVARRSVAELDLLDEAVGAQLVERSVDAREPHGAAGRTKEVEDLLCRHAARLAGKELDDRPAGAAALSRGERAVLPGHRHGQITAYLRMTLIIV